MTETIARHTAVLPGASIRASILRLIIAAYEMATRMVSIRYLFLRATTASGALLGGLIQTFVFARVLTPQEFSIFILLASCGVSMTVLDFGVVKLLFVRLRAAYLDKAIDAVLARQTAAIVVFYTLLSVACVALCVGVFALLPSMSGTDIVHYTLFFLFAALNFVWLPLRNISVAVDEFIFFETLEATRRVGNAALTFALLAGLPLSAFLVTINLLWAVLLALSTARLVKRGALSFDTHGMAKSLWEFYRHNRNELIGSGTYATTEIYVYAFPYVIVSAFFGLGSPTIILDTVFKILRGAGLLYLGACDLAVPRQTKAFAERDGATLTRATWFAVICCGLPAALLCGLLMVSADTMFAVLLGPAAVMPQEATLVLIALLLATLVQMVSHSLLVHSGFFKEVAALGIAIAVAMTAVTALAIAIGIDVIGFFKVYSGVYACGALISVVLVLRGPMRAVAPS